MSRDLLLDTHYVIWLAEADPRAQWLLPHLDDPASTVSVSAISFMEVAIKRSIGRLEVSLRDVRAAMAPSDLRELPWTGAHAEALQELPLHHRDPFDRALAAQALAEDMVLVTADAAFDAYGELLTLRG